tara:strand:- start:65 stop:364 length:300 start_codon:yes stop_codon:yes gene_type:complete
MKKWLLGILTAIGGILAIVLGIGKNKRVKEIKSKIKDNEKKVKEVDSKIKSAEKKGDAIKKNIKSKKKALKEIKKSKHKKKDISSKDASDFLKNYKGKK